MIHKCDWITISVFILSSLTSFSLSRVLNKDKVSVALSSGESSFQACAVFTKNDIE